MQDRKRLLVISTDFDGCWFHNRGRLSEASENPLIQHNAIIIEELASLIKNDSAHHVQFMIGSNRQSQPVDQRNAMRNQSSSCFSALHRICAHFEKLNSDEKKEFSVDKYLLADSYGEKEIGENFDAALTHKQNYDFSNWFFDESKLTVLYAQMHHLASLHPNTEINYHFIEDRYYPADENGLLDEDDILFALQTFFTEHPDLIPKNITLHLHFYNGADYKYVDNIQGKGLTDSNYGESIKHLTECAGLDYKDDYVDHNHVLRGLTEGDGLTKFKSLRMKDVGKQSLFQTDEQSPLTTPSNQSSHKLK